MAETSTSNRYTLLLKMTDTINSKNNDLSSWDVLSMNSCNKLHIKLHVQFFYVPFGRKNYFSFWRQLLQVFNLCLINFAL